MIETPAEFAEIVDGPRLDRVRKIWKRKGRAFLFRPEVNWIACQTDWTALVPEVRSWAEEHAVDVDVGNQCIFVFKKQKNYDRKILLFMMRWC